MARALQARTMGGEQDPRDAEFEAQIEALRLHFVSELPERRAALIAAWADCVDRGEEAPWLRLRDVAHKLSGSAPCYGLDEIGDAGRRLDKLLSGRTPCRERGAATDAVAGLTAALERAIAVA